MPSVDSANLILISERVFTGSSEVASEKAIGISGDKIIWVCDRSSVGSDGFPISDDAEVEDFGDAFVMPGFIDAHIHLCHSALFASDLALRFVGENETDCVNRMVEFANSRFGSGWLLAQGWREYLWDAPELPSKKSLDEKFPEKPVALYSGDAHTLWLNSAALRELSIDENSVPPEGGTYDKDANGQLSGIIREAAAMELMPRIVASFTTSELTDAYIAFMHDLNSHGITSICDMALSANEGADFIRDDILGELERLGLLTVRVIMYPTLLEDRSRFHNLKDSYKSDSLRVGGYKQFFDGVSSQHTAWLEHDYSNAAFEGDRGRPTVDPERMGFLVRQAILNGDSVRIHTIGDEAIHVALDIYQDALDKGMLLDDDIDIGHLVLEHLENFQEEDIDRLPELDVVASVQPRHITLDPHGPLKDLGHERIKFSWPLRTLSDKDVTLAFGTDSPVVDISPFRNLYTAITRRDWLTGELNDGFDEYECIDSQCALVAYTYGSAKAAGMEDRIGSLLPGYYADIAIVDTDLLRASPDEIQNASVLKTYVGGRLVFDQMTENLS